MTWCAYIFMKKCSLETYPMLELALLYRDPTYFAVEEIRQFGVNVIAWKLATGERRWYIV